MQRIRAGSINIFGYNYVSITKGYWVITKENFKKVLEILKFTTNDNNIYTKKFNDCELKVDFKNKKLIYPEDKGLVVNDKTTSNFSSPENFVVFECVHRLLNQGYNPNHIEIEKQIEKNGKIIKDSKEKKDEILRKCL
jgi:hypothetical protein